MSDRNLENFLGTPKRVIITSLLTSGLWGFVFLLRSTCSVGFGVCPLGMVDGNLKLGYMQHVNSGAQPKNQTKVNTNIILQ